MRPEPNIAAFEEAQRALRDKFGRNVTFFTPTPTVWPPGTVLDAESGEPLDPAVAPIASGFASAVVKCSVIYRPFGLSRSGVEDQTQTTAVGLMGTRSVGLIANPEASAAVGSGAVAFEVLEKRFKIRDIIEDDGISRGQRLVIVGELE